MCFALCIWLYLGSRCSRCSWLGYSGQTALKTKAVVESVPAFLSDQAICNFPNLSLATQALGGVLFIDEAIRLKKQHAQIISHGNQESSCMFDQKITTTCQNHINFCTFFEKHHRHMLWLVMMDVILLAAKPWTPSSSLWRIGFQSRYEMGWLDDWDRLKDFERFIWCWYLRTCEDILCGFLDPFFFV